MRLRNRSYGFTLAEIAIALVIILLLMGGLILPLTAQIDLRNRNQTNETLTEIREALVGFAAAKGRLPCPASDTSNGVEDPDGGGNCAHAHDGFVPAATLGISPTDNQGYAIDAWGRRIRYAVTKANSNAFTFTTSDGMKTATLPTLAPDLQVCATSVGITGAGTASASCAAGARLATQAVAVIYSLGKNGATAGGGADESHNPNPGSAISADPAFVSHEEAGSGAPQGEFDDIVTWLSASILYNRMIAAGQLP